MSPSRARWRRWVEPAVVAGAGLTALGFAACTGAPIPRSDEMVFLRRPTVSDPCGSELGKAPAPLAHTYTGLLRSARCDAEVTVIMRGVAGALGVACEYCHVKDNFAADTPLKRTANYMAREFVPRLAARDGTPVTCESCHAASGHGVAKLLGAPRSESTALEFMTAELVEKFTTAGGEPLRCKTCHRDNWGSPGFERKVLFGEELARLPKRPLPPESEAPAAPAPSPQASAPAPLP